MSETSRNIGVNGTALMGAGETSHLIGHGFDVHVMAHPSREPIQKLMVKRAKEAPDILGAAAV